jgi:hypothetical protein
MLSNSLGDGIRNLIQLSSRGAAAQIHVGLMRCGWREELSTKRELNSTNEFRMSRCSPAGRGRMANVDSGAQDC